MARPWKTWLLTRLAVATLHACLLPALPLAAWLEGVPLALDRCYDAPRHRVKQGAMAVVLLGQLGI